MATEASNCVLLERLPLELREAIYTEALTYNNEIDIQPHKDKFAVIYDKAPFVFPPLLSTCRQIRNEATKLFFSTNRFRAIVSNASHDTMLTPVRWLSTLSPLNRTNIKHICINFMYVGLERAALHSWHDTLESIATAGSCAVIAFAQLPKHLYERRKDCLKNILQQLRDIPDIDHRVVEFEVEEFLGDSKFVWEVVGGATDWTVVFPHIWTQCWIDCLKEMGGVFGELRVKRVSCKHVHGVRERDGREDGAMVHERVQ